MLNPGSVSVTPLLTAIEQLVETPAAYTARVGQRAFVVWRWREAVSTEGLPIIIVFVFSDFLL